MGSKIETAGKASPADRTLFKVGVISDTHGLLRPEAVTALCGVDRILHLGDVGNVEILDTLKRIAPVTAIRGNIDQFGPCAELPATEMVSLHGRVFYLVHSVDDLDISPTAAGVDAVLFGHSHRASVEQRGAILYLNPGSAGPRRFQLPITLALVTFSASGFAVTIEHLLCQDASSVSGEASYNSWTCTAFV